VAGYAEHAFGAWHPRGGLYELVRALVRRLEALGGELRVGTPVERVLVAGRRARGVVTAAGALEAGAVIVNADAAALPRLLGRTAVPRAHSLSGLAMMLGLRGRTPGLAHHTITFPADYDAEFDDVFVRRVPVADPTIYVSAPVATDPADAPDGCEAWFVLVNAPALADRAAWEPYAERLLDRLGLRDRVVARALRTPGDLERETGAVDGAIYGAAPHGRLATLRRPPNAVPGVRGLWLVGGTTHPGGGLPLVALGAATVARAVGPA
jgi:phytoene dehydrogenase-like protein